MNITYDFLYGFAFGFIIASDNENAELGQEWGVAVFIGPLLLDFYKPL